MPRSKRWFAARVATSTPYVSRSRGRTAGSMLKTTPSLTVKSSTTGHSKSSSVMSAPLTSSATAPSLPVAHGVDDVEAVADEAGRHGVRIDRGVLRRAAAEDPLPSAAQGERRVGHARGPGRSRRGSSASGSRPGRIGVRRRSAARPSERVVGGARAAGPPNRSAPSTGSTLTVGHHERRRQEREVASGSRRQALDDLGRREAVAAAVERPIEERRHLAWHEVSRRSAASTSAGVIAARAVRVSGDDRQRHVDLGDRRRRVGASASARVGAAVGLPPGRRSTADRARLVAQAGGQERAPVAEDRHERRACRRDGIGAMVAGTKPSGVCR